MKRIFLAVVLVICIALSLTLVACNPATYTLTLYDDDGTTVLDTITVEEGKAPTKPSNPDKPGYEFVGWIDGYGGGNAHGQTVVQSPFRDQSGA